jgi:hypothetical protein
MGLAGCGGGNDRAATLRAQENARAQLESQQKIAAHTALTYHQMDNAALLEKLVEQSTAQKEPFNSLAYRELRTRKDVKPDALVSLVRQSKNGTALLPLLLLRRLNREAYLGLPAELRAAVLTDALQKSQLFNTWGLPHAYLEDASKAMLECGPSAYPALKKMLADTRPAPVFGGQEFMEYQRFKYRLCDYALFFLQKMQGNANFVMPVSVEDRDALIKEIKK